MRTIGILILAASLVGLSGCAEQPGKKPKEEESKPIDDKQGNVNKTDEAKKKTAEAAKKE